MLLAIFALWFGIGAVVSLFASAKKGGSGSRFVWVLALVAWLPLIAMIRRAIARVGKKQR